MRHVPSDQEEFGPQPVYDADDSRQTLAFHLVMSVRRAEKRKIAKGYEKISKTAK